MNPKITVEIFLDKLNITQVWNSTFIQNSLFNVGISKNKVDNSEINIKNSNTCIYVNISGFV